MTVLHKGDRCLYYAHIPRTGGSYVTSLFETDKNEEYIRALFSAHERFGGLIPAHFHYPLYNWYFDVDDIPHITVVRDPFQKFLSNINQMYQMHTDYLDMCFTSQAAFDDFVTWEREIRSYHNNWFMPQYKFISPKTHVWKYESGFGEDFKEWIYDISGVEVELKESHHQKGSRDYKFGGVSEEKIAEYVRNYYNKDYEVFDY